MTESEKKSEFMKLYRELNPSLMRFARAISKTREDAKDLASDTILIAYENFHKIRNRQAFLSYLFTICSRLNKRRRWKMKFFGEYNQEKVEQIFSDISPPDEFADTEFLYKALDKLPLKMRESVVLFEISGLSLEEIKDIQGGTLSGVKSRVTRGREKLREILGTDPGLKKMKTENVIDMNEKIGEIYSSQKSLKVGVI